MLKAKSSTEEIRASRFRKSVQTACYRRVTGMQMQSSASPLRMTNIVRGGVTLLELSVQMFTDDWSWCLRRDSPLD